MVRLLEECDGQTIEVSVKGLKVENITLVGETRRIMRVCLLNTSTQTIMGNIGQTTVDKNFNHISPINTLLIKVSNNCQSIELVVEVIVQIQREQSVVEVSCGYSRFQLDQIVKLANGKTVVVNMQGGNPQKVLHLK